MPRRNPLVVPQLRSDPQYRFWGSRQPPAHRDAVRAQVSTNDAGEGTAVIRLYDPIDSWGGIWGVSASEFADALDQLDDSVQTIELHLNCPGGEVYEGIAILNLLRQHPANVVAIVDSLAASAASFIAAGADETVMSPNSQLMIHDAWGICVGPAADMQEMHDLLDKISNNVAGVYADKANNDTDWRALMLAETWYDAQEAVDAGLADRVEGDTADDEPENSADLSVFQYQGRRNAPPPPLPTNRQTEQHPMLACGCGRDVPGIEHKDECRAAAARNSASRARRLRLSDRPKRTA